MAERRGVGEEMSGWGCWMDTTNADEERVASNVPQTISNTMRDNLNIYWGWDRCVETPRQLGPAQLRWCAATWPELWPSGRGK